MPSDAQTLTRLLAQEGRGHLSVRAEGTQLVVCSIEADGTRADHLRFSPDPKGYRVERYDGTRWKAASIAGSLAACVDALARDGAPELPPR